MHYIVGATETTSAPHPTTGRPAPAHTVITHPVPLPWPDASGLAAAWSIAPGGTTRYGWCHPVGDPARLYAWAGGTPVDAVFPGPALPGTPAPEVTSDGHPASWDRPLIDGVPIPIDAGLDVIGPSRSGLLTAIAAHALDHGAGVVVLDPAQQWDGAADTPNVTVASRLDIIAADLAEEICHRAADHAAADLAPLLILLDDPHAAPPSAGRALVQLVGAAMRWGPQARAALVTARPSWRPEQPEPPHPYLVGPVDETTWTALTHSTSGTAPPSPGTWVPMHHGKPFADRVTAPAVTPADLAPTAAAPAG